MLKPGLNKRFINMFFAALGLCVVVWAWQGTEMDMSALLNGSANMAEMLSGFMQPDFTDWRYYVEEMVVTVQIALVGTLLAIIFSVPLGVLSADNVVPWWVYQPVRRLMDVFRAVNEMAFAMIFIAAVGLGPFAGVLALFVHTTGVLAKLFSEVVEAIDPQPVEGIRATGAVAMEEVAFGIIPQVLPLWISYSLYRFESNIRSAAVLGMVGAGGIGFSLSEQLRSFNFGATAAIMLMIIVVVVIFDLLSQQIRKRFV
ncbi:MAG: phosphonate ABC transporter, permease protein PhnE [Deltaproteobacteria bacterium]|jgi:phosphonate transport system permease protein|nr:phosphonate ABC transporter, permease protein PhnE [Deltaproteobacteria bacterium]